MTSLDVAWLLGPGYSLLTHSHLWARRVISPSSKGTMSKRRRSATPNRGLGLESNPVPSRAPASPLRGVPAQVSGEKNISKYCDEKRTSLETAAVVYTPSQLVASLLAAPHLVLQDEIRQPLLVEGVVGVRPHEIRASEKSRQPQRGLQRHRVEGRADDAVESEKRGRLRRAGGDEL